ncbi:hypothetical protein HYX11_00870 [Candidatus Woesearchaeota archaeon]|nr:hypothetical protein [Candidatus Woesearchaeota archaeon]
MLVFGVDVPLVELVLVIALIMFVLLIEALVVIGMLLSQMNKTKKTLELVQKMTDTLLALKKEEIEVLDRLKKR